jgi:RNA polymerase-binding transcription factor DksA
MEKPAKIDVGDEAMRFVMATPGQASRRDTERDATRPAVAPLTSAQQAALRARLVAELTEQSTRFAQHAATFGALTANGHEDPTGRDRAMAALRLYGARAAIEEIDDAMGRIDGGRYGTCLSCHQPIPFERLQHVPRARSCAACRAPAFSDARAAGSRLGARRNDGAEPPEPTRSPRALDERGSHTSEMTRGTTITH